MCFGSAENAKIGCKERRAKGKQKSGHQHGTVPQKLDKKLLGYSSVLGHNLMFQSKVGIRFVPTVSTPLHSGRN